MILLKRILIWGSLGALFYILMSYHFIFFGKTPSLLRKSELTLNYTFFSAAGKTNHQILSVDSLREDGTAELMVEKGLMSEEERDKIMEQYHE